MSQITMIQWLRIKAGENTDSSYALIANRLENLEETAENYRMLKGTFRNFLQEHIEMLNSEVSSAMTLRDELKELP